MNKALKYFFQALFEVTIRLIIWQIIKFKAFKCLEKVNQFLKRIPKCGVAANKVWESNPSLNLLVFDDFARMGKD